MDIGSPRDKFAFLFQGWHGLEAVELRLLDHAQKALQNLPVGVFAVFDAEDLDRISVIVEADTPVADAETELGRMSAMECLDITGAC
jgi:hypothetical protein